MNQPIHLLQNYYARVVDSTIMFDILKKHRAAAFPNTVDFNRAAVLGKAEKKRWEEKIRSAKPPFRLSYLIEQNDNLVGWCTAIQRDIDVWYMHNTAIFEAHRKKGLYTAVLQLMLNYAKLEGYQKVESIHIATNNAIIIPKLKAGFVITGMHISEKYGTMVELSYYTNPQVKAVVDFRSGQCRLPQNLKEHINIFEDKIN